MLSDDKRDVWPNGPNGKIPELSWNPEFTQNGSPTGLPFDFNVGRIADSTYTAGAFSLLDTRYPTTADLNVVFKIIGSPNIRSSLTDSRTPKAPSSSNSHITKDPLIFGRPWTIFPSSTTPLDGKYLFGTPPDIKFTVAPNGQLSNDALSPEPSSDFKDGDHQSGDQPLHDLERALTPDEASNQPLVKKSIPQDVRLI